MTRSSVRVQMQNDWTFAALHATKRASYGAPDITQRVDGLRVAGLREGIECFHVVAIFGT